MTANPFNLEDNVVLVSGGSRGIGLAIAQSFIAQGAKVVITGRSEKSLIETCKNTPSGKYEMTYSVCDVADQALIKSCVAEVVEHHGRIDTLVNCAGINQRKPAIDYTADEFDTIIHINLRGAFLMSQEVGKVMIAQGSGNQINIDSFSTHSPLTNVIPYSMSKAGMGGMTRGLALEWGKHGVRINGIAPGFILTDLNKEMWEDENLQAWNKAVTPAKRMGTPSDLAGTALFLASPAADFISGQTIRVDGGLSAGLNWPIEKDFNITLNE